MAGLPSKHPLTLFIDYASQPSRAVLLYCLINNLPINLVEVSVVRGEQRKQPFMSINPFKKVPAISEAGPDGVAFNLAQSHSIVRYLNQKYCAKQDKLIPKGVQERARMDQYLDFHLTNTRRCGNFIFYEVFSPFLGTKRPSYLDETFKQMVRSLLFLDARLKEQEFLVGPSLTFADISCYCEVMEVEAMKLLGKSFDFRVRFPNLGKWMSRVQMLEHVNQVHQQFRTMAQSLPYQPSRDWSQLARL